MPLEYPASTYKSENQSRHGIPTTHRCVTYQAKNLRRPIHEQRLLHATETPAERTQDERSRVQRIDVSAEAQDRGVSELAYAAQGRVDPREARVGVVDGVFVYHAPQARVECLEACARGWVGFLGFGHGQVAVRVRERERERIR